MTKGTNGIQAAWLEQDGLGSFSVDGRIVHFLRNDGVSFSWSLPTDAAAQHQLRMFRAATKYSETRAA